MSDPQRRGLDAMMTNNEPQLPEILAELSRREPIFHRAEFGTRRSDFERMTADDFWEVGASGRTYDRSQVLDVLEKRFVAHHRASEEEAWETSDFRCRKLASDVYLLTYNLVEHNSVPDSKRRTRRATIWQRTSNGWKIVYHQGTIISGP